MTGARAGRPRIDGLPSQTTSAPFIHVFAENAHALSERAAQRKKGGIPLDPSHVGKWLLYVDRKNVDEVWTKIGEAVKAGRLGHHAKVATAMPHARGRPGKHVICVYTEDATDEEDVMRVRDELRRLGFVAKIPYKPDSATLEGRYEGSGRVATYYK